MLFAFLIAAALSSPRLTELQANPSGLEQFWAAVKTEGTPLIEPVAGDARKVLVTFLWRGDASTHGAFVIALDHPQFSNRAYLEHGRMSLLPGTDVWYRSYAIRCDARFSYRMVPEDPPDPAKFRTDPNNPKHYMSRNGDTSVAELPCAPPEQFTARRENVPRGVVRDDTFRGSSGETHPIHVYTPASGCTEACNVIVFVSGKMTDDFPVNIILDNMISERRIPPSLAVMIEFDSMPAYVNAMRSNESFARYVGVDLMKWIRDNFNVSRNPARAMVVGSSAAGAGAMFVGMRYPSVFRNVLSQSGGYVYPFVTPDDELVVANFPEAEPIARELATTPRLPLRIFLAIGSMEDIGFEAPVPRYAMTTVLISGRHLRDVLEAKGYELLYREFPGLHESLSWRITFAEGVQYLFGR